MTSRNTSGVKQDTDVDPVHSEISQHATIAVPETRAFYLPYPVQHKILYSLQASVERVCFEYIKRKDPKMLEETKSQWEIDSPHTLELNQYMYLFSRSDEFGPKAAKLVNGRIMINLHESMTALRHDAVHRKRADIKSLRDYTRDASSLAAIAGDSKAAAQHKTLGNSLDLEHYRIEITRKKAEERLLATVKEVAAGRAELARVEQEAMDRFCEVHKQFSARNFTDLDRIVDANISLEYGLGIDSGDALSIEPVNFVSEEASTIEPVSEGSEEASTVEPVNENIEEASTTQPASDISEEVCSTDLVSGGSKESTWTEPLRLPTGLFRLSAEPNSSSEETLSTDPVSGIFGRLKI